MKTESTLYIELSLGPRAENQTQFWAGQYLGGRAGIGRSNEAGDVNMFDIAAQGRDRAESFRPLDLIFPIKPYLRVRKVIFLCNGGQSGAGVGISLIHAHAIFCLEEAVVDPIIADL